MLELNQLCSILNGKGICLLKGWELSKTGFYFLVVGLIVLDQFTKFLVESNMALEQSIPLISGSLHLTYILNPGAAFGMLPHKTLFFVLITVAVLSGIFLILNKIPRQQWVFRLGLALQAGGAAGNLIDRIRYGKVVDFIDFRVFPIFNVADSAITIGVILLGIHVLFLSKEEEHADGESYVQDTSDGKEPMKSHEGA